MLNENFERDFLAALANDVIIKHLKRQWRDEKSPLGKKWKKSPNALRDTGEMQDGLKFEVNGNKLFAVTSDIGKYHQFGTKKMPAREWIGIPKAAYPDIIKAAGRAILND